MVNLSIDRIRAIESLGSTDSRLNGPKPRTIGPIAEREILRLHRDMATEDVSDREIYRTITEKLGVSRSTAMSVVKLYYSPEVGKRMLPCEYRSLRRKEGKRHALAGEINSMIYEDPYIMQDQIITRLKESHPDLTLTQGWLSKHCPA